MKDNKNGANNILKVRDKLISITNPLVMGIVNATPDSFFEGSRLSSFDSVLEIVSQMVENGADAVDIGGYSTRPGADFVEEQEEFRRVIPCIELVRKSFPDLIISVDTFRSLVAKEAVKVGADIVNDVYGGRLDHSMFDTVADLDVPYVLMHSRGDAKTMQNLTEYNNVVEDVIFEVSSTLNLLRSKGVKDIIIDPGIGFAKTVTQNFEILNNLGAFHVLDCQILLGISRKSFIYKSLGVSAKNALNGTSAIHSFVNSVGISIFRVHDVREIQEIIKLGSFVNA